MREGWHLLMRKDARSIQSRPMSEIKNIHMYTSWLPDQRYRYKLQDIRKLGGRDNMTLWVPSETASWPVWTLGKWLGGGHNLFNRLRLDVTHLQALVGHKSDQIGVVVY